VDLGYSPKNVLAFQLNLPPVGQNGAPDLLTFYDSVDLRLRALPGVLSVGFTSETPMSFGIGMFDDIDIIGRPKKPGKPDSAILKAVSPDYFRVLQIPVLSGRAFTPNDVLGAEPVALVDLSLAHRYFAGRSPIGQYLNVARIDPNLQADLGRLPRAIVGVVADVREASLAEQQLPEIYLPLAQNPMRFLCVTVRAQRDPLSLLDPIRREVSRVNAQVPVFAVRSMDWLASYLFASTRDTDDLFSLFALLALLLSALGVYGLLSYSMHQRVQEIGIRMALGAQARDILRLASAQACGIIGWGIGVGVILSLALARFLSALLFQAKPNDPASLCSVALVLIFVVVAACYIPARRATRIDPMVALRHE
jgi:putative ABC transport system permease protein